VFMAMATAVCSLGHGMHLTAMPRSTQPCIPFGWLNRVAASAGTLCAYGMQVPMAARLGCLPKANCYTAFIYLTCSTCAVNDDKCQL